MSDELRGYHDDLQDGLIAINAARANMSAASQNQQSTPAWFVDPQDATGHASNSNSGTTPDKPFVDYSEIANRWDTYSPTLKQATSITSLSDGDPEDIWRFNPYFTDTGILTAQGTFKPLATVTIGTFTPPNYSAGTLGTITAQGQSGAFWTPYVGKYVKDPTAGAYFYIVADLGSATASVCQAFVPLSSGTYATIANGDSLVIGSWTKIYGSNLVYGGSFALGGLTFQQITIDTASGDQILAGYCTFFETTFAQVTNSGAGTFGLPPFYYGCYFDQFFIGGGVFWGGVQAGPPGNTYYGAQFDGDIVLTNRFHLQPNAVNLLSHVYMGQGLVDRDVGPGQFSIIRANYPSIPSRIWGPGRFNLFGTSQCVANGGDSFTTAMLLTGGLGLNAGGVGYPWVAASHSYGAAVTLTPGNIDLNGNLWDPATGAGFYVQT